MGGSIFGPWAAAGVTNADVITNVALDQTGQADAYGASFLALGYFCMFVLGLIVGYYTGSRVHPARRLHMLPLPGKKRVHSERFSDAIETLTPLIKARNGAVGFYS